MKKIIPACICACLLILNSIAQSVQHIAAENDPSYGNVGIGTRTPNSFKLEVAGNTGPEADSLRDLGSPAKRWANLYALNIRGAVFPTSFNRGGLTYTDSAGRLTQNPSQLFWDDMNNKLGVGVNVIPAGYTLAVKGGIIAEKLMLKLLSGGWPDYVFAKDYPLLPLQELSHYIHTNKHLPGIPAAGQVEKEGLDINNLTVKLAEKIEELTLYIILLDGEIKKLKEYGVRTKRGADDQ